MSTNTQNKFSTRRLVVMALFAALSYVISMIEFPIFPATPYLKLDFGNVFIMLVAFLFGPVEGVIVCIVKELLSLIGSSSNGVGQVANTLMTCAYILLPAIVYRYRKGLKSVIASLSVASIIGTVAALLANRFIIFPMYMGEGAAATFNSVFWFVVAFNLIKTISVSILTVVLYKKLSNFFKKMHV